jgi:DNA-binding MarR family transcriptional regulator
LQPFIESANVQYVSANNEKSVDSYRSLLLMSEIVGEEPLSQREISQRLGIAVGLVNSYLKNLVAKGYVRVKNFPRNRYAYLLTSQGLAEKSRLAYEHLSYFTGLYTAARQDYLALFRRLDAEGVSEVIFCGVDEVAEIAYLSLQETSIRLAEVMDEVSAVDFFDKTVTQLKHLPLKAVVITSLKRRERLKELLLQSGFEKANIFTIRD